MRLLWKLPFYARILAWTRHGVRSDTHQVFLVVVTVAVVVVVVVVVVVGIVVAIVVGAVVLCENSRMDLAWRKMRYS